MQFALLYALSVQTQVCRYLYAFVYTFLSAAAIPEILLEADYIERLNLIQVRISVACAPRSGGDLLLTSLSFQHRAMIL